MSGRSSIANDLPTDVGAEFFAQDGCTHRTRRALNGWAVLRGELPVSGEVRPDATPIGVAAQSGERSLATKNLGRTV
jgi:hypothetical protein